MYRTLDAGHIVDTLEGLERRILERFPGAGLAAVCSELTEVAGQARTRSEVIARPEWKLRAIVAGVLVLGAALILVLIRLLFSGTRGSDELFDTLQGLDSAFNIAVLAGATVFFMIRWEDRRRRSRVLGALHELRSIVHVIDMHQLTKDPSSNTSKPTPSSPARLLGPELVVRYLDYCSEMLSLSAKVAALYSQSFPDPVVTEAVSDLERTCTGLSQKIWQKINIIHRELDAARSVAGAD